MTGLTASLIYNHLGCVHRVFMDSFADPYLRGRVSPFVDLSVGY